MAIQFIIRSEITSANQAEMLAVITWMRDNVGSKILQANTDGQTFLFDGSIIENSYNDAVTTVTALQTQFTTRLSWWIGFRTIS